MRKSKAPPVNLHGKSDKEAVASLFSDVAGLSPAQSVQEPAIQEDSHTPIQIDKMTARRIDKKTVKVSWNLDKSLVERLRLQKAELFLKGLDIDQQDVVEWGLRKALESLEGGETGACRTWLERKRKVQP